MTGNVVFLGFALIVALGIAMGIQNAAPASSRSLGKPDPAWVRSAGGR